MKHVTVEPSGPEQQCQKPQGPHQEAGWGGGQAFYQGDWWLLPGIQGHWGLFYRITGGRFYQGDQRLLPEISGCNFNLGDP